MATTRIGGWLVMLGLGACGGDAARGLDGEVTAETAETADEDAPHGDAVADGDGDGTSEVAPDTSDTADAADTPDARDTSADPDVSDTGVDPDVSDTGVDLDADAAIDTGVELDGDGDGPRARVVFPPPSATTAASIVVRGEVDPATAVSGVTVAGVAATSDDGFATWRAEVPLALGDNPFAITVTRGGETWRDDAHAGVVRWPSEDDGHRGAGAWPGRTLGLGWEPIGARVALSDDIVDGLYVIDPRDGARTLVSDSESGGGPGAGYAIVQPSLVAARGDDAWVADGGVIVHIDLGNGDRVIIPGDAFGDVAGLALDPTASAPRLVVLADDEVLTLDPADGARTPVAEVGNGAALTIDADASHAYVLRYYQDSVLEVALATGARREVLAAGEPRLSDPRHIAVVDGAVFVVDDAVLVRIDPATGARRALTSDGPPLRSVAGIGASPLGLLVVDYVPDWEPPPARDPLLFVVDPREGTRVVIAR